MSNPRTMRAVIDALLPRGAIWNPKRGGDFDNLLEGIADNIEVARAFLADLANIRNPRLTSLLSDLEREYGVLTETGLTDSQRRSYLVGIKYAKPKTGSETHVQQKLRDSGFDNVYVYQNSPAIDPNAILDADFACWCGGQTSLCGHEDAFAALASGELLVNNIDDSVYIVPANEKDRWNYVFFVGGSITGDQMFTDWNMEFAHAANWTAGGGATVEKDRTVKARGLRSLKVSIERSDSSEDVEPVQPDTDCDARLQDAYRFRDNSNVLNQIAHYNHAPDGSMEDDGTASWASFRSATVTKQSTDPYKGERYLRCTKGAQTSWGASANPAPIPTMTVGNKYRITGAARRKPGSGITTTIACGGVTIWSGGSDTWEEIDTGVFTCTVSGSIWLRTTSAGVAGDYVEFDNICVHEIVDLQDGDMEASGVTAWTAGASATLTKSTEDPREGTQSLRVTYNGVNNPYAYQAVLTASQYYRVRGWVRGDGSTTSLVAFGLNTIFSGVASTTWQRFDAIGQCSGASTNLNLQANATGAGEYCEFDGIEISPYLEATQGTITGTTEKIGAYGKALTFDGAADFVSIGNKLDHENITIIGAIRADSGGSGDRGIIGNATAQASSPQQHIIWNSSDQIEFRYGLTTPSAQTLTSGTLTPGRWYVFAIRREYDGTNTQTAMTVYLDASIAGNIHLGAAPDVTDPAAFIGRTDTAGSYEFFDGDIAGIEIYDGYLSNEEVDQRFQEIQLTLEQGAYAEQLIDAVDDSVPLTATVWGNSDGAVPVMLYKTVTEGTPWTWDDEVWRPFFEGDDTAEQAVDETLANGLAGIRLYAKRGNSSDFIDQAAANFDEIDIYDPTIARVDIPVELKDKFKRAIMQSKPLHSWAALIARYV